MNARLGRFGAELAIAAVAVLLSLAVGALLIASRGHDPLMVYGVWFTEALGTPGGRAQVIFKATTLGFTGLSAALVFRAGMFNIGAEGQLYVGAFAAAMVALRLPAELPAALAIVLVTLAAALGGGLSAAIPAVLKVRRQTHEVITTMMMNFILISVVNYLLHFTRESLEVVRTRAISPDWRLYRFARGYDGNTSVVLVVIVAAVLTYVLARTVRGYAVRAVGSSPGAAAMGGIAVGRVTGWTLVVGGALAGLGGINFVLGSPGYFEQHFAPFQGYLGIAVALLGRNHPLGVVASAFLFAVLAEGSQAIQEWAPAEIGTILQAITVVFVVLGAKVYERAAAAWAKRGAPAPTTPAASPPRSP